MQGELDPPAFPSWEGLLLGAQPEIVEENLRLGRK